MFQFNIKSVVALFSKFFSPGDREAVLAAIPEGTQRIVFIDTPATVELAATVEALLGRGIEVHVRDHHDCPNPTNPREQQIAAAANHVRELVGANAVISNRNANPACSSLIEVGQFPGVVRCRACDVDVNVPNTEWCRWGEEHGFESYSDTVLVVDPDPDGLTAAMKAAGIVYDGLDADGAVLDGPRGEQTAETLSPLALLLVKGLATLPPFNPARPEVAEQAKQKLFADFVAAASGDEQARDRLEQAVEAYEAGVAAAERLAASATEPCAGVVLVDAVGAPRFDLGTLTRALEAWQGCRVTVVRKDNGPIAASHGGVQFSLAVVRQFQQAINLQDCLPEGFESSPAAGIISNTTFLLHVSQQVWDTVVLPALRARLS